MTMGNTNIKYVNNNSLIQFAVLYLIFLSVIDSGLL